MGDKGKMYLGTFLLKNKSIFIRQEKLKCESVANVKKLWYLLLLSTNVWILKIGKANLNSYSSNKEIEYVFSDVSINKICILTICTNYTKHAKKPTKEPVKQILYQRIKKKNSFIVSKNMRFDE